VDFPDEDLPADVARRARPALERLLADLTAAVAGVERAERVREGYAIALWAPPTRARAHF
ncbi:MAG: tRNA uridine-5-carboxymethylaminomethyl(34) synthesis GTPase MnmE, partial [Phenylobacterium sp.]